MPYASIDTAMFRDPKVVALPTAGQVGFLKLILWSKEAKTDGHVPDHMLPVVGVKPADARRMADVGLLERNGTGWVISAYLRHQIPAAEEEERRQRAREKARAAARARWNGGSHA